MQKAGTCRVQARQDEANLARRVRWRGRVAIRSIAKQSLRVVQLTADEVQMQPLALALRANDTSCAQAGLHVAVELAGVQGLSRACMVKTSTDMSQPARVYFPRKLTCIRMR